MSRCRRRKNNNLARYQSLNTPDSDRSVEFTKSFKFNFPYELCNPPKSLKRLAIGWVSSGAIFIFIYIYTKQSYNTPVVWKNQITSPVFPSSYISFEFMSSFKARRLNQVSLMGIWDLLAWCPTYKQACGLCTYIYIHIQKASSYKDVYIRRYTVEYIIDLSL